MGLIQLNKFEFVGSRNFQSFGEIESTHEFEFSVTYKRVRILVLADGQN